MTRGTLALVASLAIGIVLAWALVARVIAPALDGEADASPSPLAVASSSPAPTPRAPTPTAAPTASPNPTPTSTPRPTERPEATGDPRLAYAEFLAQLDEDRKTVSTMTDRLVAAADAGDRDTVRDTAGDILQFADGERVWLAGHPPADCYATAHAAAGTMLEAYATVAERAIDWADAEAGLDSLAALGDVLAAGSSARDALATLVTALDAATCLG
jgi:hypothetical protein